ncbi:2'-5' RNA ligase family protein [Psychroflexus salinarum]|uniref:2'-5' RNA ligase family protein n=1 Tax=Psychroflexus salinarum TaxID=546024 RepID=A0ABW3GV60_9FLAO
MSMYFIALIPPEDLKNGITELKKEIANRFDSKHALRLPPHITLQIPFNVNEEDENKFIKQLEEFTKQHIPFRVVLSGFGSFNSKVIYIDVLHSRPIVELHEKLIEVTREFIEKKPEGEKKKMNPHITIAYRDLSKERFDEAWSEFSQRSFEAVFVAKSLFLFKHNGKSWDILKELKMKKYELE